MHACLRGMIKNAVRCSTILSPNCREQCHEGSDTIGTFPFLVGKQSNSHFWKTHSKVTFRSECAWNSLQHAHIELGKEMPFKFCQWDVSKPLFFILPLPWCALSCPRVWRRRIDKDREIRIGVEDCWLILQILSYHFTIWCFQVLSGFAILRTLCITSKLRSIS